MDLNGACVVINETARDLGCKGADRFAFFKFVK